MKVQTSRCKLLAFFLGLIFLSFTSIITAKPTFADTVIKKSQLTKVADFTVKYGLNAGGALTNQYYVILDTRGSHGGAGTLLKIINRETCKQEDSVKLNTSYLSGVYNEPNTNKLTLINQGRSVGCYKISGGKIKKGSGCSTAPTHTYNYQGTGQGNTIKYNNHTFKVAGYSGGRIGVWNSSGSNIANFVIKKSTIGSEPENITIDAKTGEIYINYASRKKGKLHSLWYKVDASVFSKYTGKKTKSDPVKCNNSTASGTTSKTTNNNKKNGKIPGDYDDGNITYVPGEDTYDGTVDTVFFGTLQDDGQGCGVFTVMSLVITIMTVGVGIAAVIGISISGINYLTAGGNLAKTTKAKRRIYEIVIGLAAYAVITALLVFLLPEFSPELKSCQQLTPEEVAARDANRAAIHEATVKKNEEAAKKKEENNKKKPSVANKNGTTEAGAKLIATIDKMVKKMGQMGVTYGDAGCSWSNIKSRKKTNCGDYLVAGLKEAGLLKSGCFYFTNYGRSIVWQGGLNRAKLGKKNKIIKCFSTFRSCLKSGKIAPGDILGDGANQHHFLFYHGKKGKKHICYSFGSSDGVASRKNVTTTCSGSRRIGYVIHPK